MTASPNALCHDALGTPHPARAPGQGDDPALRIVSLVPSITELLVDLGLGDRLVGRTGFCVHPREFLQTVPKVGGTKGFDAEKIRALAPSHVIVNVDENRREEVEALAAFVPHIVVTHPLGPDDNPALYRLMGELFGRQEAAAALCADYAAARRELADTAAALPREAVLYLIWKKPWMSIGRDTYIARMLAAAGWDSLPDAVEPRYPEVALDLARQAGRILLPSEPYPFRDKDAQELAADPVTGGTPVLAVDGEMISWYGSRAIAGLRYLAALRRELVG
ncbi:ABC transporter substrate-binding protein [Azospira sp. I13]|uniref:helical backbone metal receptor n=1 Tax=Azospira sp. I13 TaxID=1765050 RepID=UPI000D485F6D|nr:helical backbone metal receptor [Azospira sp. I13]GBG02176.1 ABC transporter substrate-binding protein [Azospira sp. I13]